MELFKLFGRVLVETSDALKNIDKVEKSSKEAGEGLEKMDEAAGYASVNASKYAELLEKWGGKLKAFFSVAAASKLVQQIWGISDAVAAQGDAIDKASQNLGVSSDFYQEWDYILQRNGTSMDQVGESIFGLSEKVGKGDETVMAAYERLGIGINEVMTASPEELWEMTIYALMEVSSATERAALSTIFLQDKAKQMGATLNSGAESANNLKDRFRDLGGVMSVDLIAKSAEYEDAVTDLKIAWQGFKFDLTENTIPGMIEVVNGFTLMLTGDFIPGLKSMGIGIVEFFDGVAQTIAERLGFGDGPGIADLMASEDFVSGLKAQVSGWENSQSSGKFAIGLPFVPRDNYPSLLHYGERVLTRQEAEEYDRGTAGGGFNQTVNISTVSQSPAQTAAAIRAAFETVRWKI